MTIRSTQCGFTLIEMIVAVAIFSIVMIISVSSLLVLVDANRKAQALKSVMNNLSFALESMSREIRVGTDYDCGNTGGLNDCPSGDDEFAFVSSDGEDVVYRFVVTDPVAGTGQIERSIEGGSFVAMTAPEVKLENVEFVVTGAGDTDTTQPTVLMTIKGYAGVTERAQSAFNISTMVVQRVLDLDAI